MDVAFSTAKLAKLCNSEKKLRGEFGPRMAAVIQQRLTELQAAETLEDLRHLPGPRCHELTGNLSGHLAVDLVHPQRLLFTANHDPLPERESGGLDWGAVTAVLIVGITDYH